MSSAATLRRFGKGTAAVATAALVMTAFGPAAFAAWDSPNTDQTGLPLTQAQTVAGTIGVVDTNPVGATNYIEHNQGATLVLPGQNGQAIGDVRLTIPNQFVSGDRVRLLLLDRSATDTTDGSNNANANKKVGFSGVPTVTVGAVQNDDTEVSGDTDDVTPGSAGPGTTANTETPPDNPWVAANAPIATPPVIDDVAPSAKPDFGATLSADSHGQGQNIITLRINNSAKGDPLAKWVVTLSDLKVDLGSEVTPGDLRVVPFAENAVGSTWENAGWFGAPGDANPIPADSNNFINNTPASRTIFQYTVPAQVSPVTVTASAGNIVSDGTPQSPGTLAIKETTMISLGDGTYQLRATGATLTNTDPATIKVTVANGGAGEQMTAGSLQYLGINAAGVYAPFATHALADAYGDVVGIQFELEGADNTKISTVNVDGLLYRTATPGRVGFTLTGGTVSDGLNTWLTTYAGDGAALAGVPAATAFGGGGGIIQEDILPPLDELMSAIPATAGTTAIGGNNRYETARKIAKEWSPLGDEAIIASGENYPDALSSGFLSQRSGAPILLTMRGSVPADTMESLRERGVRKVYLIGGEAAISKGVSDKLLSTPSYMWSDSAKNLVPRGGNLEVVRLGGSSRYSTNALVNMYAAAQNTGVAVVGTTSPAYGSANKTTAMIARGDDFADALTANVLTSGRNTGLFTAIGSSTTTLNSTSGPTLSAADVQKLGAGVYTFNAVLELLRNGVVVATPSAGDATIYNLDGGGIVTFSAAPVAASTFTITATGVSDYVPQLANLNALPVILTPKGELGEQAKNEMQTLHIEHALVIGGASVIPDAVASSINGMNITTRRLAGTDRYDTARVVNTYAWTPSVASTTNTTPGLGFDGGVTTVGGTRFGQGEAFLANGTRFPDALVAGPWVSRRHDAMVLVWQNSIPEPTKKFLTDNAAVLDRAIGLGLGAAVSSTVITEANKLVSSK